MIEDKVNKDEDKMAKKYDDMANKLGNLEKKIKELEVGERAEEEASKKTFPVQYPSHFSQCSIPWAGSRPQASQQSKKPGS